MSESNGFLLTEGPPPPEKPDPSFLLALKVRMQVSQLVVRVQETGRPEKVLEMHLRIAFPGEQPMKLLLEHFLAGSGVSVRRSLFRYNATWKFSKDKPTKEKT